MKKYLYAGLLTACITTSAFAAGKKFVPQSPDEPLHKRAIALCMLVVVGLQAYKHRPHIPRHQLPTYHD